MLRKNLSMRSFTLASAMVGTIFLGLLALLGLLGFGLPLIEIISTVFIGYEASAGGFFLGLIWGFLTGGVAGLILSSFYNKML